MRLFQPGRRMVGLLSLGLLLILATQSTVQAIDLGCLLINNTFGDQSPAGQVVFNLNTGALSGTMPELPDEEGIDNRSTSPDGKHVRYFPDTGSASPSQA